MICAQYVDANGVQVVSPLVPQPADLATCPVVLLAGPEAGAVALTALPTPPDAATAYAWGFSIVVGPWLVARLVGAVVTTIR